MSLKIHNNSTPLYRRFRQGRRVLTKPMLGNECIGPAVTELPYPQLKAPNKPKSYRPELGRTSIPPSYLQLV
ncbi:hypothetical protein NC651_024721 [Populus alba x Populus x berolinensis]|nr:hypothetical protein NC651_024721 [Populus alba x Populus x berolinensis]